MAREQRRHGPRISAQPKSKKQHPASSPETLSEQAAFRTALCKTLTLLYTLVVTSSGVILSMSLHLCADDTVVRTCHSVFQLFMFSAALIFLGFMYGCVLRLYHPPPVADLGTISTPVYGGTGDIEYYGTIEDPDQNAKASYKSSSHPKSKGSHKGKAKMPKPPALTQSSERVNTPTAVTHSGEGVNAYLRLGAVGFGLGSVILDAFRFVELWDNPASLCQGQVYFVNVALRGLFVLIETMFLFKNHRVIIGVHGQVVRLGLLHLLATNLCLWVDIVVHEAAESFSHHHTTITMDQVQLNTTSKQLHLNTSTGELQLNTITADNESFTGNLSQSVLKLISNLTGHGILGAEASREEGIHYGRCFPGYSLVSATSEYLYPWAIEHAFISAAICYRIFTNVGSVDHHQIAALELRTSGQKCHKANLGLFSGLAVLAAAIVCVVVILVLNEREQVLTTTSRILFCVSNTSIACLAMSSIILAFWKLKTLKFTPSPSNFELQLLYIAATAYFLHFGFTSLPILMSLSRSEEESSSVLHLLMIIISMTQATIQTTFIADGYCRCPRDQSHVMLKPGRSALLFTLLCNVSLWLTSIFMFKRGHSSDLHTEYFGSFAWATILHVTLPIAIFFRFHSSVCLSDIWTHAYIIHTEEDCQMHQSHVIPVQDMDDSSILY